MGRWLTKAVGRYIEREKRDIVVVARCSSRRAFFLEAPYLLEFFTISPTSRFLHDGELDVSSELQ